METQPVINNINPLRLALEPVIPGGMINPTGNMVDEYTNLFQQLRLPWLNDLLSKLATSAGKKSFLVFKITSTSMYLLKTSPFFISGMSLP